MLRKKRRWSQAQLAKKIGVEPQRISKYERALLYPTAELALRIADIFEVSMDYLFRSGDGADIYEIRNSDLLRYMREADRLPEERQKSLLDLLDAFIKRQKFEELIKS